MNARGSRGSRQASTGRAARVQRGDGSRTGAGTEAAARLPGGSVQGWKLDLLIRDFARLIHFEVAMLCQTGNGGQPPAVIVY